MVMEMERITWVKEYYSLSLATRQKPPRHLKKVFPPAKAVVNKILKNARQVKHNQRKSTPISFLKLLDKIIPNSYFGSTFNRKLFYQIVKRILTQSWDECINISSITLYFEYDSIPWLETVDNVGKCEQLLRDANIYLLEVVVKPLIAFLYKDVRTYNAHEVDFIRRDIWMSFCSRVLNHLLKNKHIEVSPSTNNKSRGALILIPKKKDYASLNFRPIVSLKALEPDRKEFFKKVVSVVYKAVRDDLNFSSARLHEVWNTYIDKTKGRKIYAVKLDVKDAFGNVDIAILCELVRNIPSKYLTRLEKELVVEYIDEQFVKFRGKLYKWNHGLLQGDRLSSCLCELYMNSYDRNQLKKFADENALLHRSVDDYFYCNTNPAMIEEFVKEIATLHQLNEKKTVKVGFDSSGDNQRIVYFGWIFNIVTKQVKKAFSFDHRFDIRSKFRLWDHKDPQEDPATFVKKNMTFGKNQMSFSVMELNTNFNTPVTVLENVFEGMIYVAYKFDCVIMSIVNVVEDFSFVPDLLAQIIRAYSLKLLQRIAKFKGRCYQNQFTLKLIQSVSYKAFVLVLKRRSEVYKNLTGDIKYYHNLRIKTQFAEFNYNYFNKIPNELKCIRINRSLKL